MEIKKSVSITLTPNEVVEIIKKHFDQQGILIEQVHFNVESVYDPSDWRGQYPPSEEMTKVTCQGVEREKKNEEFKLSHS